MKRLPETLRKRLKKPLGDIITPEEARKGGIVVGDLSSYNLLRLGKTPKVIIRDGKVERKEVDEKIDDYLGKFGKWVFKVRNPPGHISEEAENIIRLVLEEGKSNVRIDVDGEEDLLTLPVINYGKTGDFVYYGQPGVGLVEIEIDSNIKELVNKILDQMEEIK